MFITDDLRQIRALTLKSLVLQWRQWKTNLIQLLLPVACLAFIFGMQHLIGYLQTSTTPEDQRSIRVDTVETSLLKSMQSANYMTQNVAEQNATFSAPMTMLYHFNEDQVSESVLGNLDALGESNFPNSFLANGSRLQLDVMDLSEMPPAMLYRIPAFHRVKDGDYVNEELVDRMLSTDAKENITWVGSYEISALSLDPDSPKLAYTIQYDNRSSTTFTKIVAGMSGGSGAQVVSSGMIGFFHSIFAFILTEGDHAISTSTKQMNYMQEFEIIRIDSMAGIFFYPMVLMLLLPVFLYTIVLEKQLKLRVMMELMGLKRRNYYIVTYIFLYALYIVSALEFCLLSWAFGFQIISGTNFGVSAIILILWGFSLVSMSFLLSAFIRSTIVANVVGFMVVLFGPVFGLIFDSFVVQKDIWYTKFFLLISPMALMHSIGEASTSCVALHCLGFDAIWTNMQIYSSLLALVITAVLYFVLALYFDVVLPQPWGVRKNPIFFISWLWENRKKKRVAKESELNFDTDGMDGDVIAEKTKVVNGEWNRENTGILLDKLVKRYSRDKLAVKGICLGFGKTGCLGLLGQNGAGKTTTISMLSGLFGATSGDAYVNGYSIKTQMDKIHLSLGLCPQFDVIWPDLTCMEHMLFYARIKGVSLKEERKHANELLHSVGLSRKVLKRSPKAGSLSGGMKRRLSIAMSLVGNPSVVMFDEPTTGLDPKTKRHLWKIILKAKQERCCLLTTHSLVEADVLSDRIAIFSKGRLTAVGTSMHLKSKFGEGFKLTINFDEGDKEKACRYIKDMYPNAHAAVDFATNVTYEIPKQDLRISELFERLERHKKEFGIREHGLNHVTLEDVFLSLVRKDEEELSRKDEEKKWRKAGKRIATKEDPAPAVEADPVPIVEADPIYREDIPNEIKDDYGHNEV